MASVDENASCPVVNFEFAPPPTPGKPFLPELDDLRREYPVFRSNEGQGYWVFTRYDSISEALQSPDLFSSTATVPTIPDPPYQWIPLMLDPPEHTKWRKLLSAWFSPGRVASLEDTVRQRCSDLVDQVADQGRCDFVADFASQFPTTIFLQILGLPIVELDKFMAWEEKILHFDSAVDPDHSGMMEAMSEVTTYFGKLIEQRRTDASTRGDDIVSAAVEWKIDGEPIPDPALMNCLLLLFMAGLDTVASQLSYIFSHLAESESDRARLLADPDLIPDAVEELLRAYAIVRVGRRVTKDADFHGCSLKAGDMVSLPLAFASRDEDVYEDATLVDIDRGAFRNIAFGAGPHRCLGSHLARRELVVAVEEWHRRIPDYRIPEGDSPVQHSGNGVYGFDRLSLEWDLHP
ncbi:cytochrome P450 [Rhodococcus wratislaviensis]|uniref:Putative cytochrome P450 n=1 Tax=Rhodococcus wratislaviensis NBRC 100605 TaxID=1219028 RepID=X0Q0H4_RHOWR|nr:cytochrome P450 [Rhodococcus wratislaviensis]GAF43641.1 putative cytochrome P450 [Rhodococcus wratislaviensis NBRC 100605]